MIHFPRLGAIKVVGVLLFSCVLAAQAQADDRPNIILIVADDMGYSDLGSFGSEISTPRLDAMAINGVRLTNFHAAPSCSPTRVMLMSGCDNHVAGMGAMKEQIQDSQKDKPGYETFLNDQVAALPEIMKASGYHTYMAGKWHLGLDEDHSPSARGFEKAFSLLVGGASHFDISGTDSDFKVAPYRENGEKLEALPDDFYSSKTYADKMIQYIKEGSADGKPFFGWLAFTAPHWPLHAPDEFIEKYEGVYDVGYDTIREDRLRRARALGVLPSSYSSENFHRVGQYWDQLSADQKKDTARKMAVYSAMVECMDFHIGRVVDYLSEAGKLDNTYIIFMSDNGADGGDVTAPQMPFAEYIREHCDNSFENYGRKGSFISKGRNWAQACTAPYKMWKGFTTEGGIRVPAVIYHPGMKRSGSVDNQLLTVMDVAPTVLELAKTQQPGTQFDGRKVARMQGKSFAGLFDIQGTVHPSDEPIGWELHGRKAMFMGDLKAVQYGRPFGSGQWEVYDLKNDPGEVQDLVSAQPQLGQQMAAAWDQYASRNGVILVEDVPPGGGGGGGRGGRGGNGRRGQGGPEGAGGPDSQRMAQGGRGQGGQGRGPGGQGQGQRGPSQGGPGQGGPDMQQPNRDVGAAARGGQRQPLVAVLDANFDRQITEDELRKASMAILALDANNDGELTPDEYGRQDGNAQGGGPNQGGPNQGGPNQGGPNQGGPGLAAPGAGPNRNQMSGGQGPGGSPSRIPHGLFDGGQKIYVTAGAGNGDGSSWNSSIGLVQALRSARAGDEIRVAAGTYYPSDNGDRFASFELPQGVKVLGGFSGRGDDRDWVVNPTILSGDIGQVGDDSDNSIHIVIGAEGAELDGFTITGGNGTNARGGGGGRGQGGPGQGGRGGAGQGGRGPGQGGGGRPGGAGQGGRGPGQGGGQGGGQRGQGRGPGGRGADVGGASETTLVALLTPQQGGRGQGGQGRGGAGGQGRGPGGGGRGQGGPGGGGPGAGGPGAGGPGAGGPGGGNAPIHITPQMIIGNINPGAGAGIVNFKCAPTYRNCIIRDNKARKGAGAYNMTSITTPADPDFAVQPAPQFINCSFINNFAIGRGGAISNDLGTEPTFVQCSFIDNKCDGKGGAIYNDFRCSPTLISCLFVGNSAYDGGAMGNDGASSPKITNCTFYGNHAIDMGAALYQGSGPSNNPVVTNTIIWGNKCDNGPAEIVNWHDNSPVVTYSCIEGGYAGEGNVDTDPMFVDPENGDYSLADGSPCVDAANGLAGPETDRFGVERFDDTGIPNGAVASIIAAMGDLGRTARKGTAPADIGAFERQKSSPTEKLTTVYVNGASAGNQDGRTWQTAFRTLQPAIELAYRGGAEVWIAKGTYTPTDGTDRTESIRLRDGVALYGGFAGYESSRDQRDIRANVTTLSGNIGRPDLSDDNSYHVLVGADNASLDGFVIREGNANGQAFHAKGGAMINYARHKQKAPTGWATGFTVHIANSLFLNNKAIEGGAVYNYDRSEPTFTNVVFRNNSAESGGAIVDRVGVKSTLKQCQFVNNYAKWRGGAVYFDYGSRPMITDCNFSNNKTDGHGGATYIISRASQLENSVVNVSNSVFSGNQARLRGGAIANADSGVLEISKCEFKQNQAGKGGGAVSNEYLSRTTASGLQFSGNRSDVGEADMDTDESSNVRLDG